MKAILEFDLDELEDENNLRLALNGRDFQIVLQQLDNEMRGCVKHGGAPHDPDGEMYDEIRQYAIDDATDHWRDRLHDIANDYDVKVWD